jgi:hypothetical protein
MAMHQRRRTVDATIATTRQRPTTTADGDDDRRRRCRQQLKTMTQTHPAIHDLKRQGVVGAKHDDASTK